MLIRLRVKGFKNLVNVDVWFGPFTCIAGANGVGKSNLFDAITFLSALADRPLMDAALSVRDEGGRTGDIRSLFNHVGDEFAPEMSFEVDMIIPPTGLDDLGQEAKASSTFVSYAISLRYREEDGTHSLGTLELTREELSYIKRGDISKHLKFDHSSPWKKSAILGRRWTPNYISTDQSRGVIKVHQDGGSSGKAQSLLAANLPRTALSAASAAESPTATLARREMQSWRLLQLEPSALREPDRFTAPAKLSSDGAHLPATLYHLAKSGNGTAQSSDRGDRVYSRVATALSQLIDDVRSVKVDRDERRELLTLYVTGRDGTSHAARALSDGTLRFLALAVLALDPQTQGTICLEEPENGIHPIRIPSMINLLEDLATDVEAPVGPDNPLRQVIINTHSPAVVMQVPENSLLMADVLDEYQRGRQFKSLAFRCLEGTWRHKAGVMNAVSLGKLLAYLNPVIVNDEELEDGSPGKRKRVVDREDFRQYRLFSETTT
jgi:predicted ATPase